MSGALGRLYAERHFPAGTEGPAPGHRRQRHRGLPPTRRGGELDVGRHKDDGTGQVQHAVLRRRLPGASGRTTPTWRSIRRPVGNLRRVRAPELSPSPGAPGPARGHDANGGFAPHPGRRRARLPAERLQLSRRAYCSRPSSTPPRRTPRTTAPSAPSSATKSATSSTAGRWNRTPSGGCAVGGPRRISTRFQAAAEPL